MSETRIPRRLQIAPTAIAAFAECRRKWAFRRLAHVQLNTPGVVEGRYGHGHVEAYSRDGVTPNPDDAHAHAHWRAFVPEGSQEYECAAWALALPARAPMRLAYEAWAHAYMGRVVYDVLGALPKPGPGVEVEQKVKIDTGARGWYYGGRFDIMIDKARIIDPKFYSQSSMSEYAHTAETLRTDPQCVIYSAWADAPVVEFTMLYIIKPPRAPGPKVAKAAPVTVKLTQAEIDRALDSYDRFAEEMVYYMTHVTDPNQVPHDADRACQGTGVGCDHARECALF